jgi:hypothetical protein
MKTYYFIHKLTGNVLPIKANNNLDAMSKLSEQVSNPLLYILEKIQ